MLRRLAVLLAALALPSVAQAQLCGGNICYFQSGGVISTPLLLPDGTAAAPSMAFASEPGLGFRRPGAGLLTFASGGVDYARFSAGTFNVGSGTSIAWGSTGVTGVDTYLTRGGATATLQQGAADAAAPVNQTLQAQGVAAGTSDVSGANYTITSGNGRGNAAGSALSLRTPTPVGTGNGAQTMAERLLLYATPSGASVGTFTGYVYAPQSLGFWNSGVLTAATMTNELGAAYARQATQTSSYSWTNAMLTAGGAATTWDVTVATLPAKTQVLDALVVILTAQGSAGTLAVSCGDSGVFNQFVLSGNAKAAANTVYGDAGAERGAALWTATEGNIGPYLPSYTATTTVTCRFISDSAMSTMTTSTGRVILTTRLLP
jgi:hypothetical protein